MQYRPYQRDMHTAIYQAWQNPGVNNVTAVLPTGGGKSLLMAGVIQSFPPGKRVAIAHRKELVGQIALALASCGVKHNVIGPTSMVKYLIHRQRQRLGTHFFDANADTTVASVDTLITPARMTAQKSWGEQVRLWVTDECFPAGTLVDGRPIETIKVGDFVTAFNETTRLMEGRKVVRLFKNPAPSQLVEVTVWDGRDPVLCTANHPFFTRRGWVAAKDLSLSDELACNDPSLRDEDDDNEELEWLFIQHIRTVSQHSHDFVYNIEVEGLHTYTVCGGIVVHNCHHLLRDNKWGKAITLFPNAKGLGVTATPCRADGKGLGAHSDGVFHDMIVGPTMRELIRGGYLCDYKIFAPLTYMPLSAADVGASGDYSSVKLRTASKASKIVGDVVENWQRLVAGKQTVVFATDVETATEIAQNFQAHQIRAEIVSANTPDDVRAAILDTFERREITVLVNVDLFGEGFDVPGIEVVCMARPTESYGLFAQQFGRALRPLAGKPYAIIIDHVGNVKRHGLPDAARLWSLDGKERRPRAVDPEDEIPLRYCTSCTQPYLRIKTACPWCGHVEIPDGRSRPEMVDGDLYEMDEALLAQLRGEVARIDESAAAVRQRMLHAGAHPAVAGNVFNMVTERTRAQSALRESIAWWAAMQFDKGRDDRESYKLFYHLFGIDVLSAKALGMQDAYKLANRVNHALGGPLV